MFWDNQAIYKCLKINAGLESCSYNDVNKVISSALWGLVNSSNLLSSIVSEMCPYARLNFCQIIDAPFYLKTQDEKTTFNVEDVFDPWEGRFNLVSHFKDFNPEIMKDPYTYQMYPLLEDIEKLRSKHSIREKQLKEIQKWSLS